MDYKTEKVVAKKVMWPQWIAGIGGEVYSYIFKKEVIFSNILYTPVLSDFPTMRRHSNPTLENPYSREFRRGQIENYRSNSYPRWLSRPCTVHRFTLLLRSTTLIVCD